MDDFLERLNSYEEAHCWQYDIRKRNFDEDLIESDLTVEESQNLKVLDFVFKVVEDKEERKKMVEFIKRHEWLGSISQYTTHWFAAYYKDKMAGVILMNLPNSFSKILGEGSDKKERLISRGACISWSPKNLASALLMWSINWMVKNTEYRVFTAYSDPTARELGTIYQACNFYYLGQTSGGTRKYVSPYNGKLVSDRFFRQKTSYRKFAKELGIEWQKNWSGPTGMFWNNVPDDIEKTLRQYSKDKMAKCDYVEVPLKHKYAYVLGVDKRETRKLKEIFLERNKTFPYPKERGK